MVKNITSLNKKYLAKIIQVWINFILKLWNITLNWIKLTMSCK